MDGSVAFGSDASGRAFGNPEADGLHYIISYSVDILTMRSIRITGTMTRNSSALIANNAGRATVEDLFIARCTNYIDCCGGGLFSWVYEDASFTNIMETGTQLYLGLTYTVLEQTWQLFGS